MKKGATVALALRSKGRKHGLINVRVTFNRVSQLYGAKTSIDLTDEQFKNTKLKITKQALEEANEALQIAQDVVDALADGFTFAKFHILYTKRLYGEKRDDTLLAPFAEEFEKTKSPKTRSLCKTAVNWVNAYHPDTRLTDITVDFVSELIGYMKKTSKKNGGEEMSENTLRLYLRTLSAVYNQALIEEKVKGVNPFRNVRGQHLGSIPRTKSALKEEELGKIISYVPTNSTEQFGKDFFLLSILLSGINIGDILSLRNSNIIGENVEFCRRKTRKTGLITTIPLIEEALSILKKYGCVNPGAPDEYILPYLSQCQTEESVSSKIHDINKKVNKGLKTICESVGIRHTTTYTARHTYTTLAKDTLKTEQLQSFLGHTSSRTTQNYLRSISTDSIEKNREFLKSLGKKESDKEPQ